MLVKAAIGDIHVPTVTNVTEIQMPTPVRGGNGITDLGEPAGAIVIDLAAPRCSQFGLT